MEQTLDHGALMDRVYRLQRRFGFYDITRKYYLVARDPMIAGLNPPDGGKVLEIGCGTGRNLVLAARRYPNVEFHGVDISRQMLAAAGSAVERARLRGRVRLGWADAAALDTEKTFGSDAGYDRIFMSYAVSMIPQWRAAMEQVVASLAPGGELHIAEFGDMAALPGWTRSAMYTWLRWYHVTPRPDLFEAAAGIAAGCQGTAEEKRLHRGYSWISIIRKG